MPIITLSQASSLNPGADLWIVPGLEESKTTQKMDWYLNFQLTGAHRHKTFSPAKELSAIIENCAMDEFKKTPHDESALLISSEKLLPNKWVLEIKNSDDSDAWINKAANFWLNLGKPSLRVFLPQNITLAQFQKAWTKHQAYDDFTVVLD